MDISLTLNVSDFLALSFLGFLTILGTKFVCALAALVLLPKLDGQSLWISASLFQNMFVRFPLSLFFAVLAGLVVSLCGGGFGTLFVVAIVLGVLGSLI